jgi:hypothetical protein
MLAIPFLMIGIELFGAEIPLWAIFLIGVIAVIVLWKLIKFAIKILLIAVVAFVLLMGLDVLNVFGWIQGLF